MTTMSKPTTIPVPTAVLSDEALGVLRFHLATAVRDYRGEGLHTAASECLAAISTIDAELVWRGGLFRHGYNNQFSHRPTLLRVLEGDQP